MNNSKRLFAAIAVFAMLACCLAVAVPAADAATEFEETSTPTYPVSAGGDIVSLQNLTNNMIGNSLNVEEVGDNEYLITGIAMYIGDSSKITDETNTVPGKFKATGAPAGYEYGIIYQISNLGVNEKFLGYVNSVGEWKCAQKSSGTSEMLKYVNDSTGSSTYYVLDTEIAATNANGADAAVKSAEEAVSAGNATKLIVSWNLTLVDNRLGDNMDVTLPIGVEMTSSVAGTTYNVSLSGTAVAAASDATCETDSTFTAVFTNTAIGYAFVQINGLENYFSESVTNITINQYNSALGVYSAGPGPEIKQDDNGNWYKTKSYTSSDVSDGYAFLVPKDNSTVTIQLMNGNSTIATFNFNFSGVDSEYIYASGDDSKVNDILKDTTVVFNDATDLPNNLQVTEAGIVINTSSAITDSFSLGTYESGVWVKTGTVTLTNFEGSVKFTKGSAQITQGDIDSGSVTIQDETEILIEDVTVNGDATITVPADSNVRIGKNVVINEGCTLTINAAAGTTADTPVTVNLSKSNSLTVNGILALGENVDMDAKGAVNGNGTISISDSSILTFSAAMVEVTGNGKIVNNAVTGGTINLNDGTIVDQKSSVDASATQEVVVSGEVTVVSGGTIIINGQLTVEEGAELILQQGAKLIVNGTGKVDLKGTITVEANDNNTNYIFDYNGSQMDVSGTLDLEGNNSAEITGPMNVTGTVNIGDGATATFNEKSTIAAGGNLNVEGIANGSIINAGTITIDSENNFGTFTVYMMDASTLNLDNAVGTVNVDDSMMQYRVSGQDRNILNPTKASFVNVSGVVVTDTLTVKSETDKDTQQTVRNGYGGMAVSGNADLATDINDSLTGVAGITVTQGTLNVAEGATLDMSVETKLTVSSGADLDVAGTITNVDKDTAADSITNDGEITVTGLIQTSEEINGGVVNAAMYEDKEADVFNYTTLEKAIAAGANDITITGEITIASDVTIPVGTTVTSTDAIVNIADEATLTVAADSTGSAKFKNGTVNVDGTMEVQNLKKSSVVADNVISDVATTNGDSATYTNVYKALAEAQQGEVVTITKDGIVELDKNLTIPSGVTLEIPDEKEVKALAGVTVTVDGTLSFEDGTYTMDGKNAAANKDAAKTVVNGLLETDDTTSYRTGDSQIVGAYFDMDGLQCIAPVSYAASVINDVESDVEIVGDVTAQDVSFDYTADEGFKIIVGTGSSLTAGTITLSGITLDFVGNVNATVAVADGSFTLKDVTGGEVSDVTKFDQDNNESHVATLGGTIVNAKDKDETTDLAGMVTVNGNADINVVSIDADFVVAEGATATVVADNAKFEDKTVVNGNMIVDATGIQLNGTTVVYGTVSVNDDATATAETMYIGFDVKKDVVSDIATGSVTGVAINSDKGIVLATPGSTFTPVETQAEVMLSTEYYINDALWMTAYAVDASTPIENLKAQIENAEYLGWKNDQGNGIDGKTVGMDDFEKVYADINPDIYMVYVVADEGIGTVYIDGKVMTKISNVFVLMEGGNPVALAAGSHEISYVLTNGFEGTVKMYVNGTEDSDMTFELQGNLKDDESTADGDYVIYTINLVGVEPTAPVNPSTPSTDSGDDGMGLTDYLLIILVILIVIMAIMVAFRLMRS